MLINSNFAVTLLHLQDCYTSGIKKANIAVTTFCSSRSHWDEGYWSGMSKNISSYKANCGTCIIYVPSQQREPLTLDIPKSTAVADGKQVLFSKGDSSRQAPATHLRHTFSGLAQASHALPASFWYQRFRTNRATILESGVVIR